MKLTTPFMITARLMAGVKVGKDAYISIGYSQKPGDEGRTRYAYYIDLPKGKTYKNDDIQSGCGRHGLRDGMIDLLGFLGACAASVEYGERTGNDGENANIFPAFIANWARQHDDEITMLQMEIEENETCIVE